MTNSWSSVPFCYHSNWYKSHHCLSWMSSGPHNETDVKPDGTHLSALTSKREISTYFDHKAVGPVWQSVSKLFTPAVCLRRCPTKEHPSTLPLFALLTHGRADLIAFSSVRLIRFVPLHDLLMIRTGLTFNKATISGELSWTNSEPSGIKCKRETTSQSSFQSMFRAVYVNLPWQTFDRLATNVTEFLRKTLSLLVVQYFVITNCSG